MSNPETWERLCAFPPIIGKNPHTLILGTMPGAKSLLESQYYAHPQNQFWRFMGDLYGASSDLPYDQRLEMLKEKGIAVWDVLQSCVREGSMDSDIKHGMPNDFHAFFHAYPTIRKVVFDSAMAQEIFQKTQSDVPGLEFHRVPSPSPAHARLSYSQKLELWKKALG